MMANTTMIIFVVLIVLVIVGSIVAIAIGQAREKERLEKVRLMLKEGQEHMNIVQYGGGVHNQKYSVVLLDEAMNIFEDAADLLSKY